jgi:ribosomal protein S18 acetylase RimI-like enzyme
MGETTAATVETAPAAAGASPVRVRAYNSGDHVRVLELFKSGTMFDIEERFHAEFAKYIHKGLTTDLADIEGVYRADGGEFWVATADEGGKEAVVGCIGLMVKAGGEGEVRRLFVDEAHHRRGIGSKLLRELEVRAESLGLASLTLDAGNERLHAQRFYSAHGFERVGKFVLFPEPLYEACVMVKRM